MNELLTALDAIDNADTASAHVHFSKSPYKKINKYNNKIIEIATLIVHIVRKKET